MGNDEILEYFFHFRDFKSNNAVKYLKEFIDSNYANVEFTHFIAKYFDELGDKHLNKDETMNHVVKCANAFVLRAIKGLDTMYTEIAEKTPEYKWTEEIDNNEKQT